MRLVPAAEAPAPVPGQPSSPATPGQPATATPALLQGSFAVLGGAPIGAARVLIQVRTVRRRGQAVTESTVAEAVTDAAGRFSMPVLDPPLPAGKLALRALCPGGPGYGAAVSAPLEVSVAAPGSAPVKPAPASPEAPATTP
jgi:hypothetical protein